MSNLTYMPLEEAINHPDFSHSRARRFGERWSATVYHYDKTSPSGFLARAAGSLEDVERLQRLHRKAGTLSPTERR